MDKQVCVYTVGFTLRGSARLLAPRGRIISGSSGRQASCQKVPTKSGDLFPSVVAGDTASRSNRVVLLSKTGSSVIRH